MTVMNYKINHQLLSTIGIQTWHAIETKHPKFQTPDSSHNDGLLNATNPIITFDPYVVGALVAAILPLPLELNKQQITEITTTAKKMLSVLELPKKEIVLVTVFLPNFPTNTHITTEILTKISLLNAKNIFHFGTTLTSIINGSFVTHHPQFLMDNPQFKRQAFNDLKSIKFSKV